jgi:hypothetical protein
MPKAGSNPRRNCRPGAERLSVIRTQDRFFAALMIRKTNIVSSIRLPVPFVTDDSLGNEFRCTAR